MQHVLGTAEVVDGRGVCLKDGTVLPADLVVYCGGCEYQGSPPFLAELHLGARAPATLCLSCSKMLLPAGCALHLHGQPVMGVLEYGRV